MAVLDVTAEPPSPPPSPRRATLLGTGPDAPAPSPPSLDSARSTLTGAPKVTPPSERETIPETLWARRRRPNLNASPWTSSPPVRVRLRSSAMRMRAHAIESRRALSQRMPHRRQLIELVIAAALICTALALWALM